MYLEVPQTKSGGPNGPERDNRSRLGLAMSFFRKALKTNGFAYFLGFFPRGKKGHQVQAEFHRCAGTARSVDGAVDYDALVQFSLGQLGCDRVVRRVPPTAQQALIQEDSGPGADGGQQAAGLGVGPDEFAHAWVGAHGLHSGATGDEQQVEEASAHALQRGIGMDGDAAAARRVAGFGQRGGRDLDPRPAQQVDRGQSLDLLESIRQRHEHGRHDGRK